VAPNGDPFLPFANGGFGTPSGKCEFHAETIEYTPPVESRFGDENLRARFPLELISPKHDDSMNSTFGNRPENDAATATVHIEAADAAARGIVTGDQVRVYNDRGACLLRAQVDGVVRQGVVCVPSVRWARMAADHHSVNALTSERLTDKGGGPTLYSCLVQVEKSGD
jgi:anaerobic selenocysteine-containing dehydrogenase